MLVYPHASTPAHSRVHVNGHLSDHFTVSKQGSALSPPPPTKTEIVKISLHHPTSECIELPNLNISTVQSATCLGV